MMMDDYSNSDSSGGDSCGGIRVRNPMDLLEVGTMGTDSENDYDMDFDYDNEPGDYNQSSAQEHKKQRKQRLGVLNADDHVSVYTGDNGDETSNLKKTRGGGPKRKRQRKLKLYQLDPEDYKEDPWKQHQIRRALATHGHRERKRNEMKTLRKDNLVLRQIIQQYKHREEEIKKLCICGSVAKFLLENEEIATPPTYEEEPFIDDDDSFDANGMEYASSSALPLPIKVEAPEFPPPVEVKNVKISKKKKNDKPPKIKVGPTPKPARKRPIPILPKPEIPINAINPQVLPNLIAANPPPLGKKSTKKSTKFQNLLPKDTPLLTPNSLPMLRPAPPNWLKVTNQSTPPPPPNAIPRLLIVRNAENGQHQLLPGPVTPPQTPTQTSPLKKIRKVPTPPNFTIPSPPASVERVEPIIKKKLTPPDKLARNTLQRISDIFKSLKMRSNSALNEDFLGLGEVNDEMVRYFSHEPLPLKFRAISVTESEIEVSSPEVENKVIEFPPDLNNQQGRTKRAAALSRLSTADMLRGVKDPKMSAKVNQNSNKSANSKTKKGNRSVPIPISDSIDDIDWDDVELQYVRSNSIYCS